MHVNNTSYHRRFYWTVLCHSLKVCVHLWKYTRAPLHRPDEGVGSLGAGIQGCEPPSMGTGIQTGHPDWAISVFTTSLAHIMSFLVESNYTRQLAGMRSLGKTFKCPWVDLFDRISSSCCSETSYVEQRASCLSSQCWDVYYHTWPDVIFFNCLRVSLSFTCQSIPLNPKVFRFPRQELALCMTYNLHTDASLQMYEFTYVAISNT